MSENKWTGAVVYARYSPRPDSKQVAEVDTIDAQFAAAETACKRMGIPVLSRHHDRAKSGRTLDRDGLWDAILRLSAGNLLMVTKLDRLSRSVAQYCSIEERALRKHAQIYSLNGEGTLSTSPEDKMVRQIITSVNECKATAGAMLTKARMRYYQKQGRRMGGGPAPYGMAYDVDDRKAMHKVPEEQAVIREILAMHAEGVSNRGIARELEKRGRLNRGRPRWPHDLIRRILLREL